MGYDSLKINALVLGCIDEDEGMKTARIEYVEQNTTIGHNAMNEDGIRLLKCLVVY